MNIHENLYEQIMYYVTGSTPFDELVESVAKTSRVEVNEVVAAVWDLIQSRHLKYNADDATVKWARINHIKS